MRNIFIVIRYIIYIFAFFFGAVGLTGGGAAIVGGQDSLAGRAVVIFVNDAWETVLGTSTVFYMLLIIQLVVSMSLIITVTMSYLKRKNSLIISSIVFIVFSIMLDIARIAYTTEYGLFIAGKYIVFAVAFYLVHISFQRGDAR